MNAQTSKGLRIALLVYTIYSILYGLLHVVSPELVGAKDPAIERVLGAAVLAQSQVRRLGASRLDDPVHNHHGLGYPGWRDHHTSLADRRYRRSFRCLADDPLHS